MEHLETLRARWRSYIAAGDNDDAPFAATVASNDVAPSGEAVEWSSDTEELRAAWAAVADAQAQLTLRIRDLVNASSDACDRVGGDAGEASGDGECRDGVERRKFVALTQVAGRCKLWLRGTKQVHPWQRCCHV
jgi:hypothetical protein